MFSHPDWLKEPRGADVSPDVRWYPLLTFWLVAADMAFSTGVPAGHGHSYGAEPVAAWADIAPPDGWTPKTTSGSVSRCRRRNRKTVPNTSARQEEFGAPHSGGGARRVESGGTAAAVTVASSPARGRRHRAGRPHPRPAGIAVPPGVVGRAVRPCRRRPGRAGCRGRHGVAARVRKWPNATCPRGRSVGSCSVSRSAPSGRRRPPYRAALGTVAAEAFGPTAGRLLQSAAFGLSHIADARTTGEPIVPTVLVTGLAGWVFGWVYERSGSLIAPMLAHLAVNEAGAVAALAVQNTRARAISL